MLKLDSSVIEKYIQDKSHTNLDKNLEYLAKISKYNIKYDLIKPAIESRKRASDDAQFNQQDEVNKLNSQTHTFTDKDFEDFEKSYFNR